jgi:sarcosine oxidase subunit beta
VYDITPDHQPIGGPTTQLDGWWQAVGWSGRGMLLAPFLTELLVEHLVSGQAPAMLRMFLPDRFGPTTGAEGAQADYYARYSPGGASASG